MIVETEGQLYAVTDIDKHTVLGMVLEAAGDLFVRINKKWVSLDKIDEYDEKTLIPVGPAALGNFDANPEGTIDTIDTIDLGGTNG